MKAIKNLWLYIAGGVGAVILIGMSLPWAGIKVDVYTYQMVAHIGTYPAWDQIWLVIPALLAIATFIVGFWKIEQKKWLQATLVLAAITILLVILFGIRMLTANFSLTSDVPKVGFWITLLGLIGMTVITTMTLFGKKTLPIELPVQENAEPPDQTN